VKLNRLRIGEMLALIGAICVIASMFLPWYENAAGKLDAWDTFGVAVLLLIVAAVCALGLAAVTVTERSTSAPVAGAVLTTFVGLLALVCAVVRLLERPDHATSLCAGAWVALAGALAILAGGWQSMRDERTELYTPSDAPPRPPPAS
jgi:uncharacterized membrane protein